MIECRVCNDDGLCKNSPSNKDYVKNNKDCWLGTDIYDCQEYLEEKEGKPKGSWMVEWMKRLNGEPKETYESDFVKWSKTHSRETLKSE